MSSSSADRASFAAREDEKVKLESWEADKRPLSHAEITVDPQTKVVGHSSKHLRKEDFELIKTLGTGMEHGLWGNNCGYALSSPS